MQNYRMQNGRGLNNVTMNNRIMLQNFQRVNTVITILDTGIEV